MSQNSGKAKGSPGNWSRMLREIKTLCEVPGMTIPRLQRLLDVALLYESHDPKRNPFNAGLRNGLLREYRNGGPIFRAVPMNNTYGLIPTHLHNEIVVPTVADMVTEETDAVIELGCGFGRHMFALRDLLEHRFPRLKYFAGELSADGREAAARIHELEPRRTPISFHVFDHLAPNLDFLGDCRNVIFFTVHSIEQVRTIGTTLFDEILRRDGHIRCLHAEPIGWQLNAEIMKDLDDLKNRPVPDIKLFGPVDDHYSAYVPGASGWNRDLMETLLQLAQAGRIKLNYLERHVAGDEIYNPTTQMLWTKV